MNKKKILIVAIIAITLIIGISHIVFGEDSRNKLVISDDDYTQGLSYIKMRDSYNNVYCIEHGQRMNGYKTYNIKTKVVLNGEKAQIYTRNADGKYTLTKTVDNPVNNVLGAILTSGTIDGKIGGSSSEYTYGYRVNGRYTDAQLALYRYIGNWIETVEAEEYGFEYNGSGLSEDELAIAEKMIAQAENKAEEYSYNVTIYLLKYSDLSYQTLLVTDPQEPVSKKIQIPVKKEWLDDENAYETRAEITVNLYANDVDTGKSLTLNSSNNWEGIFEDLEARDEENAIIQYTIKEISNIPGYETTNTEYDEEKGFVITNRLKTEINVKKVWNDKDNLDGMRKASLTVTLYSNGSSTNKTVTLNEENGWTAQFTDLYKCDINGNPIEYTVVEEMVEGYTDEVVKTEDEKGNATYIITNTHTPKYDGYIEITGKVWLDKPDGKGNDINGVLDNNETGLGGIKVTLKDANGNQFDVESTTTTSEDGTYIIKVNYDNSKNVYKLYENSETVKEKLKTAYIEFEYDGMKYTTVATSTTGENTSKAVENETIRNSFDTEHSKVTSSTTHPDNWTNNGMVAITKDVISFEKYADKTNITREEVLKYCNGDGTCTSTNPNGAWNEIITSNNICENCSGNGHSIRTYEIEVEKIQNVNLGLFEREQSNVAIFSDLSKVEVTMNSQKYTYIYGVRGSEKNNVGLQAKFQNKDTYTYRRPVNPSDIAYIQEEANSDMMNVIVTYEIKVANLSTTLTTTIHNIANYFDNRYTLNTTGWILENGTEFNKAISEDLNITLNPQTESSAIELKYSVSIEAIKGLLKENATLNNAVEIESYSTIYGEKTLYAEQRTGERINQPYGGYDYNSHPGNAEMFINAEGRLEAGKLEDDTDIAPSFVLCKDETPKILSGTIWEDEDKDNGSGSDNFRLGDGKKSENENVIANVKAELYKVNDDGTLTLANLYKTDGSTDTKPAVAISNSEGYYSFGNSEEGYGVVTDRYLIRFTYGEETADVNINARNYKSTIISQDTELYNIFKGTSTSENWHLNINKGYSIAVDDIEKRVAIEDLQYSNFNDSVFMTADSKIFEMQVEFNASAENTSSVKEDGKTLKDSTSVLPNELNVFDFGIIERAREDIYVTKTVDYLKVILANGQTLIEGNPMEQDLSYVKAIGYKQNINSSKEARKALEKQMLIEIDSELIQGAQLEVRYAINVTNNSEKEYDYYVDGQIKTEYYYFGTNDIDKSPIITNSVNCLVDYVDADFVYTWENSEKWSQASIEELATEGNELINETTLEEIKSGKYIAYITSQFSELAPGEKSQTEHATAKKMLTSKEENVYENHLEILKIDSKTARTIKGKDKKGIVIAKEYKPGNYVPSTVARYTDDNIESDVAGRHEQDDDITKIVITPPTGLTSNITTYIIAAGAQLMIVLIGIIYIKKKRLIK